ncbi:glycine betaine ABC transporter substrate-binding protein [Subdoligranulum variabile]|uniref:glycine betaine ABC transporter substrate-binding protein n=1 Tax=Subdoligranulum variabile TaxID=214851 RepID=UPI0029433810|nr:glycine betaine ABC transporter substrate-binding protein [Subdoligranulum variabile]
MKTGKLLAGPLALLIALVGCSAETIPKKSENMPVPEEKTMITFADVGWDSIKLNNALAGLVAENLFGYTWQETPGSTPISHEALMAGEVDVLMEEWTDNISSYQQDLADGKFTELGINFNDNYQGFYIPRYLAEQYPDLKTVKDLAKYPELFPDPEGPQKGIIYGGITGWSITEIMGKKVEAYGLDQYYNYFVCGSDAILNTAMTSAWDKQEPIVAYYWEPTWLLGMYDFVLLEDEPYDSATYQDGIGACPAVTVTVAVSNDFAASNPEYCEFLSKFSMPSAIISEALAYMQQYAPADYQAAARWLLTESHPELLDQWLTPEQAEQMRLMLSGNDDGKSTGFAWLFEFPAFLNLNTEEIDSVVRSFAVWADAVLSRISHGLGSLVAGINWILSHIPWPIFILLIGVLGWRAKGRIRSGVLYGALVSMIGAVGYWDMMELTLSIVIASVIIALLIGLPVGVLLSGSARANKVMRPVLDTMQTMPVFVYLIPALLLFGTGNASAVIATVIYAVVPVIRLTSLGIQQVDKEVVEAAKSFGSTRWQALIKVQIPQALPTIMTGVNQTLMMAMAMVVTTSMIGARGLGMEVLEAVNRIQIGRGLIAGTSVVILAIVLDRLTQSWGRSEKRVNKKQRILESGNPDSKKGGNDNG